MDCLPATSLDTTLRLVGAPDAVGYTHRTQLYDGRTSPQTDNAVPSFQWESARSDTGPCTESRGAEFLYSDSHVCNRETLGGNESPHQSHRLSPPRSSPSATFYNFFPDSGSMPSVDIPAGSYPSQPTHSDTCLQLFPREDDPRGKGDAGEGCVELRRNIRDEDVTRQEEEYVAGIEVGDRNQNRDRDQGGDGWGRAAEGQELDHRYHPSAQPELRPAKKRLRLGEGDKYKSYLGVRMRAPGRWTAEIKDIRNKVRQWLGTHDSGEEAAVAYDTAILQIRGAHGKTNFLYPGHKGPSLFKIPAPHPVNGEDDMAGVGGAAGVGDAVRFRDGFSSSTGGPLHRASPHYPVSQNPRFIIPRLQINPETTDAPSDMSGDTCPSRQSPSMPTSPGGLPFGPGRSTSAFLSPMAMSALKATSAMAENQSGTKDLPWTILESKKGASSESPTLSHPHPTSLGWDPRWEHSDTRHPLEFGLSLSGPRIRKHDSGGTEDVNRTRCEVQEGMHPHAETRGVEVGGSRGEGVASDGKLSRFLVLLKEQFDKAGKESGEANTAATLG